MGQLVNGGNSVGVGGWWCKQGLSTVILTIPGFDFFKIMSVAWGSE